MPPVNRVGTKIGTMIIVAEAGRYVAPSGQSSRMWVCRCDCGNEITRPWSWLSSGRYASCGCLRTAKIAAMKTTHGQALKGHKTKTYMVWEKIISRCERPTSKDYARYGGRGIRVCERWLKFENFYADMGEQPAGLSVERKDNNAGYTPENCIWADRHTQSRNMRRSVFLAYNGQSLCLTDACAAIGVNPSTIVSAVRRRGLTHQQAFDSSVAKRAAA